MRAAHFSLVIFIAVAACARDLPEIDNTISKSAQSKPIPTLLQIDRIIAPDVEDSSAIEQDMDTVQARAALLKRKAEALRNRDIYDGQDKLREL